MMRTHEYKAHHKTFDEVALAAELNDEQRRRFVLYMRQRWADSEDLQCRVGYAMEWAQRFKAGIEYAASDLYGQAILRGLR